MTAIRSIGPYESLRVLGEGGMGTVHLARDPVIGRLVAIKLLRAGLDSPTLRARLGEEARAAGRLHHPNIVTIFHVDEDGGCPYIVMEYVEGESLAALILDGAPIGLARKLLMLERICSGLACAHDAGLVHRDIKPANIVVDAALEPKILDFGLAKLPDARLALTREHDVVGTLSYMSPEQLSNGHVDHRSDLFAVAAIAYELVTGRRAFVGDTQQVVAQILSGSPPLMLGHPEINRELAATIGRGLARNPDERFQSAREMEHAFRLARERCGDAVSAEAIGVVAETMRPPDSAPPARKGWKRAIVSATASVGVLTIVFLYDSTRSDARLEVAPASVSSMLPMAPTETSSPATSRPAPSGILETSATTAQTPPARNVRVPTPTPVPSVAAEAPLPSAPAPSGLRLPVGSLLMVNVSTPLDSRRSVPGDQFVGVLGEALALEGRVIAAAGSRVEGRVEQSSIGSTGRPFLELSLTAVAIAERLVPIRTGTYRAVAPSIDRGTPFVAIIIGTAAGAALGGVVGGGPGAVAGGAIGAVGSSTVRTPAPQAEYHLGSHLPFRIAEAIHLEMP